MSSSMGGAESDLDMSGKGDETYQPLATKGCVQVLLVGNYVSESGKSMLTLQGLCFLLEVIFTL